MGQRGGPQPQEPVMAGTRPCLAIIFASFQSSLHKQYPPSPLQAHGWQIPQDGIVWALAALSLRITGPAGSGQGLSWLLQEGEAGAGRQRSTE